LVKSSYLYANDLRFHYYYDNLDGHGNPIVLLHGLASNGRIWEKVMPILVEAGYACYAPDLRGHGLSDAPDGDYGFETYFKDLAALFTALEIEKPLLVGHSWGCSLALDYAAHRPFGPGAPRGIILVDGGVIQIDAVEGATWEDTRQRLAPPRLAGTPLEAFMAHFQSPRPGWQPDDQDLQIILANFTISEDERIAPHLSYEHHMQIVRAMWEFQAYEKFARVGCSVLAVPVRPASPMDEGQARFLGLKEGGIAYLLETYPGKLSVHWMEDSVHDVPLQRPEALSRLILEFAAEIE
jgi:pimeloyl-ACP methyl ester carboxylesterase